MNNGLFITFDGLDGSGKSTAAQSLYSSLQEPGRHFFKGVQQNDHRKPGVEPGIGIIDACRQACTSCKPLIFATWLIRQTEKK